MYQFAFDRDENILSMGLNPINFQQWLVWDDGCPSIIEEKRLLLANTEHKVLATLPGYELEILRLLEQVEQLQLAERQLTFAGLPSDPLQRISLMAQEDFCLLTQEGEQPYKLVAASLCAPTFWHLEEKLGQPVDFIHRPVPGFEDKLAAKVSRFFNHLKPGQIIERGNWTLCEHPARFQPDRIKLHQQQQQHCFLRTERQTLMKLPDSSTIVFTILVNIKPIMSLKETPQSQANFIDTLQTLPNEMAQYKGIEHLVPIALHLLM